MGVLHSNEVIYYYLDTKIGTPYGMCIGGGAV
jgi:hypothetical protein